MTAAKARLELSVEQLEAIASPVRLAIVQRLDADGAATAKELAQRLGRPVTALYHHLELLQRCGLLRVVESRKGERRPEAVYACVSARLSSARAARSDSGRRTLAKTAARAAGATLRAFSTACERAAARLDGRRRNTVVRHFAVRADAARLERINALIDELDAVAGASGERGEDLLLTVVMAPLPTRPEG